MTTTAPPGDSIGSIRDVMELLLRHGADVNAADNAGRTATGRAAQQGHAGIAELLRKHGGVE